MKVFKEYLLDNKCAAEQTVYLPNGSEVVNVLNTKKGLVILALCVPDAFTSEPHELRTFKICSTEEIFYAGTVKYIGSFESLVGIKHAVEVIKE